MTPNLTLPLFAIAEERKIAQITASEQTILEALRDMQNVKVSEDGRKVELK